MKTTAWQQVPLPRYPKLHRPAHFDVVVIGGGITGVTTAFLLSKAGKRVALFERDWLGAGETSRTTAHLTQLTDLRLPQLVKHFGKDVASLVWQAGGAAINTIAEIVRSHEIECQFCRVPGFLHAAFGGQRSEEKQLRSEADLALELGIDARFLAAVPYFERPGIRFSNQAKFHPLAFLSGLAARASRPNCQIFEHTEVTEVHDDPLTMKAGRHPVTCDYVVIATHVPLTGNTGLLGATAFQTKLAAYSSYAVRAKVPRGQLPVATFWDTSDPYYYLRVDRGPRYDTVIFGGQDHKTGQVVDTGECFQRLETVLAGILPVAKVDRRWSGQVVETHDGLPFIGESAERQFIATGFAGNGMTFGVLSAMMACDRVLGQDNPWQKIFAPDRKKLIGGAWDYVKENADFPYYLVRDRVTSPSNASSTKDVKRGEGRIVKIDGERVACSRDENGELSTVSAVCTHMGCLVRWNGAEHTWDCPCHGSRFQPGGEVIAGPAETALEPIAEPSPSAAEKVNAQSETPQRRRSPGQRKDRESTARRSG